eukprot:8667277-Pyramimonas_sp.AAC.1
MFCSGERAGSGSSERATATAQARAPRDRVREHTGWMRPIRANPRAQFRAGCLLSARVPIEPARASPAPHMAARSRTPLACAFRIRTVRIRWSPPLP